MVTRQCMQRRRLHNSVTSLASVTELFSTDEEDQKEKEELSDLIGKVLRGPVNGEAGDHR